MFNFRKNNEVNNQVSFDGLQQPMDLNDVSFDVINRKPIWNPKSFVILSCLFSFLPAAIMYSVNYRRLGFKQKGSKFIIMSILGFIGTLILFGILPGNFGKYLGMGINGAVGATMMKEQLPIFEEHIARGGKKASLVLPIIFSVLVTGALLFPIFYTINIPETNLTFGNDEIYFTSNVKESEVKSLGDYLTKIEVFRSDDDMMSVKLDKKTGDIYVVSVIVEKDAIDNPDMLTAFSDFGSDVSKNVFNNAKVEIHLCDNRFNEQKVVNPQDVES